MRIIRNNFYTVVKLWINQFGVMFLGFLVLCPPPEARCLTG